MSPEQIAEDVEGFQTAGSKPDSPISEPTTSSTARYWQTSFVALTSHATRTGLAAELQKVLARFIDGHAGVSGATSGFRDGFLPFLIVPSGDRFVAIEPDRSRLLAEGHPFITSIDGVSFDRWLEAAAPYVMSGSLQYRRRIALRLIRSVEQFRFELGLATGQPLVVELSDAAGRSTVTLQRDIAARISTYGLWPPLMEPRVIDGEIGYVRLPSMNKAAVERLRAWFPRFADTKGLIIDVRGNGGGIRTPILELAAHLLDVTDDPRIGSVAKYQLASDLPPDHLSGSRYVYRQDSPRFTERERRAILDFQRSFQPEWIPPPDQFSDWHYLVLTKEAGDERMIYRQEVVILMDEYCFSATDIFLGTFKGWPRLTLIGRASGGGSARSLSFQLPNSRLTVRCASMASFQPNGLLYDTHGIEPDIEVEVPPAYYLKGGPDVILERALTYLRSETELNSGTRH